MENNHKTGSGEQITFTLSKRRIARMKAHAKSRNESLDVFINRAIDATIECEALAARSMREWYKMHPPKS